MDKTPDHAGILAPPPLIHAAALALVFLLRWRWPMPLPHAYAAEAAGALLVVAGLALGIAGRWALGQAGTSVNPWRPTTALVQTSSYRFSRHPLYVGMAAILLGVSLLADTGWGAVLLVPVALLMHVGVVMPEERYLERKFGEEYRRYRGRVRLYL